MGRAGDAQIDAELARDAHRRGPQARGRLPGRDPGRRAQGRRLAAAHRSRRNSAIEGVFAVAAAFGQVEHAALLAPYAVRYFEVLPDLWASRGDHMKRVLADGLFPYASASPELLARIDAFLAAAPRDPALVRILVERRDTVERALRSRELAA